MDRNRLQMLQDMAIFGGLENASLQFLLDRAQQRVLEAGDCFFHEGEPAGSMFVLDSGHAEVLKEWEGEVHRLRELEQGDCFGEVALLDMLPRSATVCALDTCIALEIPRTALYELYQDNLEQFTLIMMNMAREVSRRLRDADMRLFQVHQAAPGLRMPPGFGLT